MRSRCVGIKVPAAVGPAPAMNFAVVSADWSVYRRQDRFRQREDRVMATGFFPPAPAAAARLRRAGMSRRSLLRLAGAGLAGTCLSAGMASAVAEDAEVIDPSISVETVTYPGRRTPLKGYVARPKGASAKRPAVIVIHEVRGINAHFRDLARRLAMEGFLAFVPELASGQGTFPEGADEIRDHLQKLTPIEIAAEYQSASDFIAR
eukprot:gene22954-24272_t